MGHSKKQKLHKIVQIIIQSEPEKLLSTPNKKDISSAKEEFNSGDEITRYYNSTTSDMQNVQNQMTMIIQDIQRKVNEIYVDRKAAGFGNGQVESNTKWINAQRISRQAQSNIVQRIKDTIHNEFTDLSKPENRF
ncbi:20693_t:CDS:2 [Entrophospora sp. SA101]|nr:20693_t:CDS:2 [Entrophospora sp. SA101]